MKAQEAFDSKVAELAAAMASFVSRCDMIAGRDVASIRRTDVEIHAARRALQRVRRGYDRLVESIPAAAGGKGEAA